MIKVSVLYPNSQGARFDHVYYKNNHIPLIKDKLKDVLRGAHIDKGLSSSLPDSDAPFVCVGHLLFDSLEIYRRSYAPHAVEIRAGIPNYTDITPIVLISEVIE